MSHGDDDALAAPIEVIDLIIDAAAPEKADAWRRLRDGLSISFHPIEDRKGVTMHARGRRVEFDAKTMAWIWLLGFTAWHAFRLHGPHLFWRVLTGRQIDAALRSNDGGYAAAEGDYEALLYAMRDFHALQVFDLSDDWPAGVPQPQKDKAGFDIEQQAAFDLTMIATAYVLLHEVKHVEFNAAGSRPTRPEEEFACDAFARHFILDDAADYAAEASSAADDVIGKRAAGIAIGIYILYAFTPSGGRAGSAEYPPVAERIEALFPDVRLADDHWFWDFAASLLIALIVSQDRSATIPELDGAPLAHALVQMLRGS